MELAASACFIIITVVNNFLLGVSPSKVLGTKIAQDMTVAASVDVADTDDSISPRAEVFQAAREAREAAREARRAALEEARARREEAKERFQEAREEFREKLAVIRDAQKQGILEHIADRLEHVKDRWTTHFDNVLTRLSEILAKIGTRADRLEEEGRDVSSVRDAITDAEAAIDVAQDAVNTQGENSYIIEISDEDSLREDVQSVRNQLHDDLTSTRDAVKSARQAVHDAFQALKDVRSSQDSEGGADEG